MFIAPMINLMFCANKCNTRPFPCLLVVQHVCNLFRELAYSPNQSLFINANDSRRKESIHLLFWTSYLITSWKQKATWWINSADNYSIWLNILMSSSWFHEIPTRTVNSKACYKGFSVLLAWHAWSHVH